MSFHQGFRQPVVLATLRSRLLMQPDVDPVALDATLRTWIELPEADPLVASQSVQPRAVVIDRVLRVSCWLLQSAGVPVFDPGGVQASSDAELTDSISAWLPDCGPLPLGLRNLAYSMALDLVGLATGPGAGEPLPENTQAQIERELIQPARSAAMGGESTVHILRAAFDADIPFLHLGGGRYQIGWGSRGTRISASHLWSDSHIGVRLVQSKSLSAEILRRAGIPAARNVAVDSPEQAVSVAASMGWPVVIKPDDRDRGEGVTTDLADANSTRAAFECARRLSPNVLVEKQLGGICHRIVVARGKLGYAFTRHPRRVQGDGSRTVAELVAHRREEALARPSWLRGKPWLLDDIALRQLERQGLGADSVPARAQWVNLRPRQSSEWGGDPEDITASIHPENVRICLSAAALFGLDVAGIDLMSEDPRVPWYINGGAINEVNSAPHVGGNPISRRWLPRFLLDLFPQGGRVEVGVVIGGDRAWQHAHGSQAERVARGERCFLTDHRRTIAPDGSELILSLDGVYSRCSALLLDSEVDSLIVVVSNDELLASGSPVDRITSLTDLSREERGRVVPDEQTTERIFGLFEPMLAARVN